MIFAIALCDYLTRTKMIPALGWELDVNLPAPFLSSLKYCRQGTPGQGVHRVHLMFRCLLALLSLGFHSIYLQFAYFDHWAVIYFFLPQLPTMPAFFMIHRILSGLV